MLTRKNVVIIVLAFAFLTACTGGSPATPPVSPGTTAIPQVAPTLQPATIPAATPSPSPSPVPTTAPYPPGISNEPLTVITTEPADKSQEVSVTKDSARVVVQFNHPVVPLVSVEQQKDLPQPLTLQPAVTGTGKWINTSTFTFTPNQNLTVATVYTATLAPLKDMLGQTLNGFSWSFKTASPAVTKLYPADGTISAATTQPITITFNTEMDRTSTESRLSVKRADTGAAAAGRLEWQANILRFVPAAPLEYGLSYKATLAAGAQDINKVSATTKETSWTFRTVDRPGVRATSPQTGATSARLTDGFRIDFASPMKRDSLKVTIQPTITNQSTWWESEKTGGADASTIAHIGGSWAPSKAYTVTIGADSLTRYDEKLGKDYVVRFTTAPLDPEVYLNVPGNIGMYDANAAQTIVATFVNTGQIDYRLYRVERSEFLSLLGRNFYQSIEKFTPKEANSLRSWTLAPKASLNATSLISTTLTADGSPLAPGIYFIRASSPTSKSNAGQLSRHLLAVTGINLAFKRTETESLVWVTSLKSGQPIADQPLSLFDSAGKVLVSGKSNKDGIWRANFALQNAWEPMFVLSEVDGQIVAAVGSDWNSGIMSWDYNMPSQPQSSEYYANVYTDRSIYRPGQTVYYRGILRRDNDAQYSLPQGVTNIPITVRDSQGKQITTQTATLTSFGTFNGQFNLGESSPIGYYNLSFEIGKDPRRFSSGVGFQVAEYRRPEFQVTTKTDKPEYVNGDTIRVDVDSSYFFGGPVSDSPVTWRLLSEDYFFHPDTIQGWWDFTDYDISEGRQRIGGVIKEGKGKTDASGKFQFQVPADLKDVPLSQNFTLEAEITDINNQAVSNRIVVPVHKADYYIGLHPQRYVGTVNQEQGVDVITVDTKGITVTNAALTVSFYEHQWFSVREKRDDGGFYWRSAYTDTLVSKVNVTTDARGSVVARFTPTKGGVFKVVAEGTDKQSNKVRSATYLWVSGRDFVNWRMENNDRIDLVADKKEYLPGETAEVLIPAPFANSEALLTIERGSIREVRRLTIAGNSEKIKVPILADYAPNVFVSVFLVKGRGADSPTPQFKMGYTNLAVSTIEKRLTVAISPDKQTHYGPGEQATLNIKATDSQGKPVQSELSVAVVDKAVQSLIDDLSESPLNAFYGQRGLGVQTAATLVRSVERLNQNITPEAKGGGGGLLEQPVRREFKDTAFWKADVVTDESGQARVNVPLPDNLTTWNVTAKGVTAATLVGEGKADVVSTKDLLVRPSLPRFFVVGDKARLEAVVNNNSDKDVSADVVLQGTGITLSANARQPLTIRAHDKAKVGWDVTIGQVDQVVTKFSVSGGGLEDAIEQTLPVHRAISLETVATAGQVDNQIKEQVQLPPVVDKSAGELKIELSPSLAAASLNSLNYLDSFDYECSEQTVSKFFPNVATYLALKKLGIEREDLRKGLESNVSREVQRLYGLQHQDGGWGWWSEDASLPTLTAYALLGLANARDGGFAVDKDVMNRAEQFLTRYLDRPMDVKQTYVPNERAFVLYVLSEMGRNVTSRAVSLYDQRATLQLYGKAFLLMALQRQKQPQAQTLSTELANAAISSATGVHWEEQKPDYWTMNTNTRTTALVIMALGRVNPKNNQLANAVRWLMVARKDGHWDTTQETAWSILSLTEFMQSTGELAGNYSYQVQFNGKPLGDGKVDKSNVDQGRSLTVAIKDMVQASANDLIINRSGGDGRLYYSAYLNYYLPVENLTPLNRGIVIGRQYEAVDPQTLKPTGKVVQSAKIGDYVQVTLTLIAQNDLHYLILEDPLPAGFEAVDTTLKTSSVAAQGAQLREQQDKLANDPWSRPYWYYWAHSEVRDDRVAAFATFLGRGTYEYSYMMRASVAGEFRTLPAHAQEMYFPDVFGRSNGALFVVSP